MFRMMLAMLIAVTSLMAITPEKKASSPPNKSPASIDLVKSRLLKWEVIDGIQVGYFAINNHEVHAYYDQNGVLLGFGRFENPADLENNLAVIMRHKFSDYAIKELYLYNRPEGSIKRLVKLENSKGQIIIRLEDDGGFKLVKQTNS